MADALAALERRLESAAHEIEHGVEEDAKREIRQAQQLVMAVQEQESS